MPDRASPALDPGAASRLRRLNVIVGAVHALQAVVLLAIATAASLPIRASFLVGPPGAGDYGAASLGSLRIDWVVAAFLLLAAVDHLTLSVGRPRRWYEANVARGINPARWWEYSVSASLMVVLIAMLAGVSRARRIDCIVWGERGDDPLWARAGAGECRPRRGGLAAVHLRVCRRRRAVDRDHGADHRLGHRRRWRPWVRRGDLHHAVPAQTRSR
jgi:hypothetical protein